MQFQNFGADKPNRSDIFHTSGYATAQSNGIGATSRETFQQRQTLNRRRSLVRQYRGMSHVHPQPAAPQVDTPSTDAIKRQSLANSDARTRFREPPARHNPYA